MGFTAHIPLSKVGRTERLLLLQFPNRPANPNGRDWNRPRDELEGAEVYTSLFIDRLAGLAGCQGRKTRLMIIPVFTRPWHPDLTNR
jgi:hypothetical protein